MKSRIKDNETIFEHNFEVASGDVIEFTPRDPITGKPYYLVPLRNFNVEMSIDYSSLCQVENDLQESEKYFRLIPMFDSNNNQDIRNALFSSAVISYCRVFNSKYGSSEKIIHFKDLMGDGIKDVQQHESLMKMRNKNFGHTDANKLSIPENYIFFEDERKDKIVDIGPLNLSFKCLGNEDVIEIADFVRIVAKKIKIRIQNLKNIILENLSKNIDLLEE